MNHFLLKSVTLLSLGAALSLTACQKNESPKAAAPEPATVVQPEEKKVLSAKEAACETSKKSHNPLETQHKVDTKVVSIERHFQRVVRKTCEGSPISDKIETVKSPRQDVTLEIPVKTEFQSVFVFSETTCDHKLSPMPAGDSLAAWLTGGQLLNVTGDGKKQITLKGDVANALLTFELAPGLNNVYVDYHLDCAPSTVSSNNNARVGQSTCVESVKTMKVLYPIEVKYTEKTLEGVREIRQDEKGSSCEKK